MFCFCFCFPKAEEIVNAQTTHLHHCELIGFHMWSLMQSNCASVNHKASLSHDASAFSYMSVTCLIVDQSKPNIIIKHFAKRVAVEAPRPREKYFGNINELVDTLRVLRLIYYQWMVWFKITNSTYPINSFKVAQNNSQHFLFNHSLTVGAAIIVSKNCPIICKHAIIKITLSSIAISLKMSSFPLIYLPSCYRTVQ